MYEHHINQILSSQDFKFKATVHDRCIYQTTYNDHNILLLRQVDHLTLSTNVESIAKEIYKIIGDKLELPAKPEPPFTYLGLINDYNNVEVNQCKEYIEINTSNYIDQFVTSQGRNDGFKHPTPVKPLSPMPEDSIANVFDTTNSPVEDSAAHKDLEKKMGFSYCSLLGKLMYAYVTCCPDIGYFIYYLSKFGTCLS